MTFSSTYPKRADYQSRALGVMLTKQAAFCVNITQSFCHPKTSMSLDRQLIDKLLVQNKSSLYGISGWYNHIRPIIKMAVRDAAVSDWWTFSQENGLGLLADLDRVRSETTANWPQPKLPTRAYRKAVWSHPRLKAHATEVFDEIGSGELLLEFLDETTQEPVLRFYTDESFNWQWRLIFLSETAFRRSPEFAEADPPDDLQYLFLLNAITLLYSDPCFALLPEHLRVAYEVALNRLAHGLPPEDSDRRWFQHVYPQADIMPPYERK